MQLRLKIKKTFPLLILLSLMLLWLITRYAGLIINLSPSMPLGLYKKVKLHEDNGYAGNDESGEIDNIKNNAAAIIQRVQRGDIVLVCLDKENTTLGLQQGYLMRGLACHNSSAPLLKTVLAISGDNVVLDNAHISVNGEQRLYPTSRRDSRKRMLQAYNKGNYPHTSGYWLVGTVTARNSWDSRYWGPIDKSQIIAQLKPLLIFPSL